MAWTAPSLLLQLPGAISASFAHVANLLPFEDVGQRIALASWVHARNVARTQGLHVSLYTVEVANEPRVRRDAAFTPLPDLTRTARHVMAVGHTQIPSLPLLRDILERAMDLTEDFILLTIADLGLMADFYVQVQALLDEVAPAQSLSILRVGIGNWSRHVHQRHWNKGGRVYLKPFFDLVRQFPQIHPGSDCFVFPRAALPRMLPMVGYVFYGVPPFGKCMLMAMGAATGGAVMEVAKQQLTFHLNAAERDRKPNGQLHFHWQEQTSMKKELHSFNKYVGFAMASRVWDQGELVHRLWKHFQVPSGFKLEGGGHFVDLEQCFREVGIITGLVLVISRKSQSSAVLPYVLHVDLIQMINASSGRIRSRQRVWGLPPALEMGDFGPNVVVARLQMPYEAGDCLGWAWRYDVTGLSLGSEEAQGPAPTLYLPVSREYGVTNTLTYPLSLRHRLAVRAIVQAGIPHAGFERRKMTVPQREHLIPRALRASHARRPVEQWCGTGARMSQPLIC
ncbi:kidins220 [Symbiodinium sp. CCMP2592]|nr:kidins220 [Symbiodinium sp. CCMP2592]